MESKKIRWGLNSYEFYKPKRNKLKISLVGAFVIGCLVTPFTNWLLIPIFKLIKLNPLWLYN